MTSKQIILITEATGNVGGGAVVSLAKRGARVVQLGRKLEKLEARADSIRASLAEAQINFHDSEITTLVIDFSNMESTRHTAREVLGRFQMIHGLVLSGVALVQNGPNILPSGHELMFATNVIGPFLFTNYWLKGWSNPMEWSFISSIEPRKKSIGMILKASRITRHLLHMKGPKCCTG